MINEGNTTQRMTITTLGRYRLLRHVGKGGMGDVWLAEDPRLHRQVAIKTLPSNSQSDHEFLLRFEREAQAAAALNHPHILSVHDYGEQALPDGQTIIFIVMPYVSGGSLADRISALSARGSAMPQGEAILYLSQAAEAIDYAHEQGVIHRDIKPANMLLRSDTWLLLADFGIARILTSDERLTQAGVGFGTPEYMAPEQAQGRAEFASDNYSLAVIAYHFFTGRLPFKADTPYATTIQHITLPPLPPRQLNPSLTPAAEAVLLQGLAKDPRQRPPSARTFVAELQRSLTSTGNEPTFVKPGPPQTGGAPFTPHPGPNPSYPPYATKAPGTSYSGFAPTLASGGPVTGGTSYAGAAPTMTRRRLLIGGGAALVAVGGALGVWAFATHLKPSPIPHPVTQKTPASSTRGNTGTGANGPWLLLGHNKPVAALAWSPVSNVLASAGSNSDGQVFLWDMQAISQQTGQNPQPKAKQSFSSGIDMLLSWSPKGDMLAIANAGNNQSGLQFSNSNTEVFVYTGDLVGFAPGYSNTFLFQNVVSISAMAWAPGPYLFTMTQPAFNVNAPYTVQVWDPAHPQHQLTSFNTTHDLTVGDANVTLNPLAVAPNTTPLNLAIGTQDGVLIEELSAAGQAFQWKQRGLLKVQDNNALENDMAALAWSPDGRYIAAILSSTDSPTNVTIWDLHTRTYVGPPTLPDSGTNVTTLVWNPASSSTLIAAGATNGAVYIWDITGNTLPQKTLTPTQNINSLVRALAWSADGQWLAAAYNDNNASILVWKL
jgi:serine/threonine protein kinase